MKYKEKKKDWKKNEKINEIYVSFRQPNILVIRIPKVGGREGDICKNKDKKFSKFDEK